MKKGENESSTLVFKKGNVCFIFLFQNAECIFAIRSIIFNVISILSLFKSKFNVYFFSIRFSNTIPVFLSLCLIKK